MMDKDFYDVFALFASVSILVHLFSTWLDYRQLLKYQNTRFTDETQQLFNIDESKFIESKSYTIEKMRFSILSEWTDFCFKMIFIYYRFYEMIFEWVEINIPLPFYFQISVVTILITLFNFLILGLFKSWYGTFVIEQKYKFNNMTYYLFFTDIIKQLAISNTVIFFLVPAIFYLIEFCQLNYIYIWLFVIVTGFQIVMTFVYPILIEPLFNKLEPLKDNELKTKIIELSKSVHFASPSEQIFTIDSSKRSNHSNVYVTGFFGKKRIVIYDTMLSESKYTHDEILSIIAHELGHWVNNDIYHQFSIALLIGLVESLLQQYFLSDELSKIIISSKYAMISALIVSPLSILRPLFTNWFSRRCETNADLFSCRLGYNYDLQSALIKLNKQNKQLLTSNDWLFSLFHHSHPSLLERVDHIKSLKKYD
jgi:STE24 endopeptidase